MIKLSLIQQPTLIEKYLIQVKADDWTPDGPDSRKALAPKNLPVFSGKRSETKYRDEGQFFLQELTLLNLKDVVLKYV